MDSGSSAQHVGEASEPWDAAKGTMARFLRPLLEAAAAEQGAAADAGANGGQERPATGRVLQLLRGECSALSPWRLGMQVPPPLVPLLWEGWCAHLAQAATDSDAVAATGGAGRLALQLGQAASAAPSSAHGVRAGCVILQQFVSKLDGFWIPWQPPETKPYVEAVLEAAAALRGAASGSSPTQAARMADAALPLSAALAAAAWHAAHTWQARCADEALSGLEAQALAAVRRCMADDAHGIVHLLLSPAHGVKRQLQAQLTGTATAEEARRTCKKAILQYPGRGGSGKRAGRLQPRINWLRS